VPAVVQVNREGDCELEDFANVPGQIADLGQPEDAYAMCEVCEFEAPISEFEQGGTLMRRLVDELHNDRAMLLTAVRDLLCGFGFHDLAPDDSEWTRMLVDVLASMAPEERAAFDCEQFREVAPEAFNSESEAEHDEG